MCIDPPSLSPPQLSFLSKHLYSIRDFFHWTFVRSQQLGNSRSDLTVLDFRNELQGFVPPGLASAPVVAEAIPSISGEKPACNFFKRRHTRQPIHRHALPRLSVWMMKTQTQKRQLRMRGWNHWKFRPAWLFCVFLRNGQICPVQFLSASHFSQS